ncbi:MAG: phospho-sugar mutase [Propionibacteriaceae bacterium]|jgi:phosphomannomutase|nr:phospho-sugar mutase [Propionibacteriaceae bacterium]
MPDLEKQAAAWLAADPDENTRAELGALIEAAKTDPSAQDDLADRFASTLQFGTAGLRGALGAGPNRMNRAVVIRAAYGLIDYLFRSPKTPLDALPESGQQVDRPPRVVVGNDARKLSRQFALDTVEVITAAGGEAILLPDRVPTPVLAYAVRQLEADAGVMVTASHNPPQDNGYKVYLGGRMVSGPERGAQIVPPHDTGIAACIAAAPPANEIPLATSGWKDVDRELVAEYTTAVAESAYLLDGYLGTPAPISIVHTAMHGVGGKVALDALGQAGFEEVHPVPEQAEPDPAFPTVAFPNPEEPGAIDLALGLAQRLEADVVLANDPDADRCAVAIPDPRSGWRMLHGDELGCVLAEAVAHGLADGAGHAVLVNSIVSSRLLGRIAAAHGLAYQNTLTGFKWMGRVPSLAFAYEEAIGYCVRPDLVHDKDGLSTAVLVAALVAKLKGTERSIADLLDDLARQHGLYLTSQLSARFSDLEQIPVTMAKLREHPPAALAGSAVATVADLAEGYAGLPPTDGVLLLTERDDRVIVRPSGTEPKVKCYLEVVEPASPDADFDALTDVRKRASARLDAIKADLQAALFG